MIVVIDGPAGSGKSSTAKAVAKISGIEYLDSGALYRAVTWMYIQAEENDERFFDALTQASIEFRYRDRVFHVNVNSHDITDRLRQSDIADLVSTVASFPRVRSFVNECMHKAVQQGQYIAEGRDLGTAVFPDADLKFFMIADAEERSRRRYKELKAAGVDITLSQVRENIRNRDRKDSNRKTDPLKKAPDAIELNTTKMSFEEQVQHICSIIDEKTELTIT